MDTVYKPPYFSIKTMCEMLSDVIESEKPLLPQVILSDEKFEVDLSYKMFEPPVTPPPDEPIEIPTPNIFTIAQVCRSYRAPVISYGEFQLTDLSNKSSILCTIVSF